MSRRYVEVVLVAVGVVTPWSAAVADFAIMPCLRPRSNRASLRFLGRLDARWRISHRSVLTVSGNPECLSMIVVATTSGTSVQAHTVCEV